MSVLKFVWQWISLFLVLALCGQSVVAEPPATVAYLKCTVTELQPNEEARGINVPYHVYGSGVLVWTETADGSLDAYILTAKHVGQRGSSCLVSLEQGYQPSLSLIRVSGQSSELDAMVFRFVAELGDRFRPANFKIPKQGMDIRVWGVPSGSSGNQVEVRQGVVSSDVPDELGFLSTSALTARGMSGGPAFDLDTGALVGIVAGAQIDQYGLVTSYKVLSVSEFARDFGLVAFRERAEIPPSKPISPARPEIAEGWLNSREAIRSQLGPDGHCRSNCDGWAGKPWELTIGSEELANDERISSIECACLSAQLCWFDENGPRGPHQSIVGTNGKTASCFISARTHQTRWSLTANIQKLGKIGGWVYVGQFIGDAWTDPQFTELASTAPENLSGAVVTSFGNNLREASSVEAKVLTQISSGEKLLIEETNVDSEGYVWARAGIIEHES